LRRSYFALRTASLIFVSTRPRTATPALETNLSLPQ
jgi:hypothetical protein